MAVGFRGAGGASGGIGALTATWPGSQQENDFALMLHEVTSNQSPTAPSGWSQVSGSPITNATYTHKFLLYGKLVGVSESSVTIADTGDHQVAQILVFSGVDTTTPIEVTATSNPGPATALAGPGVTTTSDGAGVVCIFGLGRDADSTASVTGWANSNLASITEVADFLSSTGGGGGFAAAWGIKTTAGATGDTTATQAASAVYTAITLALKPAAGGGSPQTISVTNPSETDSSQSITSTFGALSVSVGYANDVSIAQTITPSIGLIVSLGHATESDSSQTITASTGINISLAHAVDTNYAQSIAATIGSLAVSVSHTSEANAAQEITGSSSLYVLISAATESDSAQTVTAVTSSGSSIDSAYEVDSSQAITTSFGALLLSIGSASEADSAQLITPSNGLSIAIVAAYETATVQAITPVTGGLIVTFNIASESDSSRAITVFIPSDAIYMTPACRTVSVDRDIRSVNIDMDFSRCIAVPFDSRTVLVGGCNA